MKTITKGSVFALLIVLSFISCQKEADFNPGGGGGGSVVKDSIYISTYVELDTTEAPGLDTAFKYLFTYDNKKRITKISEYNFSTGTLTYDEIIYENYFYTGNDTLPFKATLILADAMNNPQGWDTSYFQYNSAGYVIKDSTRHHTSGSPITTEVINYTQLSATKYKVTGTGISQDSLIATGTFVNGNITQQTTTSYTGGVGSPYYSFNETFDTHVNPFFRISVKYPIASVPFGFEGYFSNMSRNNPLTFVGIDPVFGPESYTSDFVYRTDGLPVISRLFDPAVGPGFYLKGKYIYTSL